MFSFTFNLKQRKCFRNSTLLFKF